MKKHVKKILYTLAAILIGVLIFQLFEFQSFKRKNEASALRQAEATTKAFKDEIQTLLSRVETEGKELGQRFGENDFSVDDIKTLIRESSLGFKEIRGVTACYEPYGFNDETKLFCPYYNKGTGNYLFIEDSYDYTVKGSGTAWYTNIVENGASWVDPYYGSSAQEWFIDYGVPFYYASGPKSGQVRGIIDFSLGAGDFKNLVHKLSVGKTAYSFITSKNGSFIAHPDTDFVGTKKLEDIIAAETNQGFKAALETMTQEASGHVPYYDAENDDQAYFFFDHLENSGHAIGMGFLRGDLVNDQKATHRRYIRIILNLSFIIVMVILLYFGRDNLDRTEIEVLSGIATVLLFANVLLIGYLQHSLKTEIRANESPPIVDTTSLESYVSQQRERAETLKIESPTPVPTGLYIERMEFADSYNVNIGGFIWQKYPLDLAEKVEIGFRLPQMSPFAESSYIEESYRETITGKEGSDGYLLVGWDVRVTLRLNLEYKNYPFDKRHLDIKLLPASLSDNLMLVPDLSGYSSTNRARRSGISPAIKLPGNTISETYFNFSTDDYQTDFGFNRSGVSQNIPGLHFNIHQKRKLLNAFVTYLIPIFVALSLIYILILACEKTEARQGIIESMAAFFFVLIFSHIDLRKDIVTADLIFMEYFYFITYAAIILSTFNLITYTKSTVKFFDYNDNQIFRVSYFPAFLLVLLAVMLIKFY